MSREALKFALSALSDMDLIALVADENQIIHNVAMQVADERATEYAMRISASDEEYILKAMEAI
jgi:hypothetical protein